MKKIDLKGISYIEPLEQSSGWYWGTDGIHGDLYEAEELFKDNHPFKCNRLVFVHYPDARVVEPIEGKEGQYFGKPVFYEGKIVVLLVDFMENLIKIYQINPESLEMVILTTLELNEVEDCYNLLLQTAPLMLTRSPHGGKFQVLWPEQVDYAIGERETFHSREGHKMYFSRWFEDPEYREEVVVRDYPSGEVLEVVSGTLIEMPMGEKWVVG